MDVFSGSGTLNDEGRETGILRPNKDYRPTAGALIHSEDTEFNDALRARGIIPAKPKEANEDEDAGPSYLNEQNKLEQADLSDDEALLELEDDIPSHILEQYRSARIEEEAKRAKVSRRFGTITPIGREEYTREVTEASEKDLDGIADEDDEDKMEEYRGKGTGVICFLWKDAIPESQLLGQLLAKLAIAYPSSKFVSIRGDMCIANYPDKNIPTMLLYRAGQLVKQIIGLGKDVGLKGMQTSVLDVEALLTIYDAVDPFLKMAPTASMKQDDDEDSEEEATSGKKRGMRRTADLRSNALDSDDDLDL